MDLSNKDRPHIALIPDRMLSVLIAHYLKAEGYAARVCNDEDIESQAQDSLILYCGPSIQRWMQTSSYPRLQERRVLFLSTGWKESEAVALGAGLLGYIGPEPPLPLLIQAVEDCLSGISFYHAGSSTEPVIGYLTQRQLQVLTLAGGCQTDAEIALHLSLSPNTVRHHMDALHAKLQAERRGDLIARAERGGFRTLDNYALHFRTVFQEET